MSGRTIVLDTIEAELAPEEWAVIRNGVRPDQVSRNVVIAYTDTITRTSQAQIGVLSELVTLLVIVRESRPEAIDDALDAALLTVVAAIEDRSELSWTVATRTAVDDKFEGWSIPVTVTFTITRED